MQATIPTTGYLHGYQMAMNAEGDVFLATSRSSSLEGWVNFGGLDLVVMKYNASLVKQWEFQYGSAADDAVKGLALTAGGELVVAGETQGTLFAPHGDNNDVFITKLPVAGIAPDTVPGSGSFWVSQASNNYYDVVGVGGVAVAPNGDLFVAGETRAYPYNDVLVMKFTSSGMAWRKQFGNASENEFGQRVALGAGGQIVVSFRTVSRYSPYPNTFGLASFDADGTLQWSQEVDNNSSNEEKALLVLSGGDILLAGETRGSMPGFTNMGSGDGVMGPGDAVVMKFSASGTLQWTQQFGTSELDRAECLLEDVDGGFFLAGSTWGSMPGFTNDGGYAVFVMKFDADGASQWTYQYDISCYPDIMRLNSDGELVIAGASVSGTVCTARFPNSPCPTAPPQTTSSGARAVLAWVTCLGLVSMGWGA